MFGFDSAELAIIAVLALIFIGPKDLPKVMRTVGQWYGRVRGMARHFTAGLENMIREAELEEMEKKWREENERIMREHPLHDAIEHPAEPVMTALPAPTADMVVEPAPPEAIAEAAPVEPAPAAAEPAPKRARAPRAAPPAEGEHGPELPFDLPPKS